MTRILAIDLGAESGRGVIGTLSDDRKLTLNVIHRFPNGPVKIGGTLYWNTTGLVQEIRNAIRIAAEDGGFASVGIDTWGVDFALLGKGGTLVGSPVHYRDARTDGFIDKVFAKVSKEDIYAVTGIQTMQLNTLFQLASLAENHPEQLAATTKLLFMPDFLHGLLTGVDASEFTIASTSQMLDITTGTWAVDVLERLGIPTDILPDVLPAGATYGGIADATLPAAVQGIPVIAPGGHDTACAVAAVPATPGDDWAYLSSGTWSLLGVELTEAVLTREACELNVTNEGGVCGTVRLLKNIAGLWLVQECRRAYARLGRERSYDELTRLAAEAPALAAVIDPDHASLAAPDDMPRAIRELCIATGVEPPEGVGATIRCCLDSLGLKYRKTLRMMERVTGRSIRVLHIVGGGSQNRLLNQIAADATGCTVIAGPVEATAIGNVLLQGISLGIVNDLNDLRSIVRDSVTLETYTPDPEMHARFSALPDL